MDSWERFDETTLPDKKAFYSNLYIEDITDIDIIDIAMQTKYLKHLN